MSEHVFNSILPNKAPAEMFCYKHCKTYNDKMLQLFSMLTIYQNFLVAFSLLTRPKKSYKV